MNTYIYIHVCCINNWKEIFNKLLDDIKKSGLYEKINKIKCNILSQEKIDMYIFEDEKIEIIGISNNLKLYEVSTINMLHKDSLDEDFNVLYLHTKGVRHNNCNINVNDWVRYLSYFNIYKHEICSTQLKNCDAVGVNLHGGDVISHYAGNFWWSKSQYIRNLDKCLYEHYCSPEMWIVGKRIGRYVCLWNSNVDHYHNRYEEHNYIDKPIQHETMDFYNK